MSPKIPIVISFIIHISGTIIYLDILFRFNICIYRYYGSDIVYFEAYYAWYFRGHESNAIYNVKLIFPRLKRSNPYYTMQAWVGCFFVIPWIHVLKHSLSSVTFDYTSEN